MSGPRGKFPFNRRWPVRLHTIASDAAEGSPVSGQYVAHLGAALDRIQRGASGVIPTPTLLTWVLGTVAAALDIPLVKYLELRQNNRWLVVRAGIGWPSGVIANSHVANRTTSLAGLTLRLGTPCVCPNLREATRFTDDTLLRYNDVVSTVATSVLADRPYGVLTIHTLQYREFTSVEIDFLADVAAVLADAIRQRGVPRYTARYCRSHATRASLRKGLYSRIPDIQS